MPTDVHGTFKEQREKDTFNALKSQMLFQSPFAYLHFWLGLFITSNTSRLQLYKFSTN